MFCQLEYNHRFSNSEYFLKGHPLDSNWEQNCGTALLHSVDWRRGRIGQGMCPAGESASIPFLVSVLCKVSSNWTQISIMTWTKKKENKNKNHTETQHLCLSAIYKGLEIKLVSWAQHGGPKNGDCHPAFSKTLLLMALLPHRHKYRPKESLRQDLSLLHTRLQCSHSVTRSCGCCFGKRSHFASEAVGFLY